MQVDLEGFERFMTTPGETVPAEEFDVAADKGYCHEAPGNTNLLEGSLDQGRFVVFMVGEPHMPNLVPESTEPGPIKKICFKVLSDEYWDEA
ncbi:YhcH/YjgK/YiaL family protein [Atopobiaceae bacterium HCP3S3_A4]